MKTGEEVRKGTNFGTAAVQVEDQGTVTTLAG